MKLIIGKDFKAVLFDVDGTIAMTEQRNRKVIEDLANEYGFEIKKSDWNEIAGKMESLIWEWILEKKPDFAISQDDFVDRCRAGYLKSEFNVLARPGIKKAIEYFKSKGLRIIAVSNSQHEAIEHSLKAAGCYEDMEFIISASEDVENPKPAPDAFLLGIKKLAESDPSINADNCIIFEDSGTGVEAGYESGCYVAQFVDEDTNPHDLASAHVHDEKELKSLCEKLVP